MPNSFVMSDFCWLPFTTFFISGTFCSKVGQFHPETGQTIFNLRSEKRTRGTLMKHSKNTHHMACSSPTWIWMCIQLVLMGLSPLNTVMQLNPIIINEVLSGQSVCLLHPIFVVRVGTKVSSNKLTIWLVQKSQNNALCSSFGRGVSLSSFSASWPWLRHLYCTLVVHCLLLGGTTS